MSEPLSSPPATWVQWRVVTGAEEVSPKDQYAGDLWGLYVAVGDMEPKLLADHKLPDGLTVSIQSGIKHTPKGMADAQKEWEKFLNGMRSSPTEEWWRQNLDLPAYYSFHALNRLLGNVDLRPDGNHGYYRRPDGRWAPIPWDNDMMFVPRPNQPGHIDAIRCLKHPSIALEYRNRAREVLDLFAADAGDRGGQVGQLVADLGAALTPRGHDVDWPRLDEARWNFHPRMTTKWVYFVKEADAQHGGGPWKRTLATADFAGFRKYVVDFCTDSRPTKNYVPHDGDPRGHGWGLPGTRGEGRADPRHAGGGAAEGGRVPVRGVGVRLASGPQAGGAGVACRPRREARVVRVGRLLAEGRGVGPCGGHPGRGVQGAGRVPGARPLARRDRAVRALERAGHRRRAVTPALHGNEGSHGRRATVSMPEEVARLLLDSQLHPGRHEHGADERGRVVDDAEPAHHVHPVPDVHVEAPARRMAPRSAPSSRSAAPIDVRRG